MVYKPEVCNITSTTLNLYACRKSLLIHTYIQFTVSQPRYKSQIKENFNSLAKHTFLGHLNTVRFDCHSYTFLIHINTLVHMSLPHPLDRFKYPTYNPRALVRMISPWTEILRKNMWRKTIAPRLSTEMHPCVFIV